MSKQGILLVSIAAMLLFSCKDSGEKQDGAAVAKAAKLGSQESFLAFMVPHFKAYGDPYRKYQKIFARKAVNGEEIQTVTADGLETTNTAKEGDIVVKNQTDAQEMYIMGSDKFKARYRYLGEAEDGFSEYEPVGKVVGLELTTGLLTELELAKEFEFIAPWGEKMVAKRGDYLVTPPDYSEVYRVARKEFFETYEEDE